MDVYRSLCGGVMPNVTGPSFGAYARTSHPVELKSSTDDAVILVPQREIRAPGVVAEIDINPVAWVRLRLAELDQRTAARSQRELWPPKKYT